VRELYPRRVVVESLEIEEIDEEIDR